MVRAKEALNEDRAPGPVSFRLGDLADEVMKRAAPGNALGAVVRRDLDRYYQLLRVVDWPGFTVEEADTLAIVVQSLPESAALWPGAIIHSVTDSFERLQNRLTELDAKEVVRPRVPDPAGFLQRLAKFPVLRAVAVLDSVERYWAARQEAFQEITERGSLFLSSRPVSEAEAKLLQAVHLVHPVLVSRYLKEQGLRPRKDQRNPEVTKPGKR